MDFFAGLLDRSQDQATVLQRRQPSRFEPPAWEANPMTGLEGDDFPAAEAPMAIPQPPLQTGAAPIAPEPAKGADGTASREARATDHPILQPPPLEASHSDAHALALDRLDGEIAGLSRAVRRLERQPLGQQSAAAQADAELPQPLERETIIHQRLVQGQPAVAAATLHPHRPDAFATGETGPSPGARQTRREEARDSLPQQRGANDRLSPAPLVRKASRDERPPRAAVIVPRAAAQPVPAMPPMPSVSRRESRTTDSVPAPVPPTTVHVSIGRIEIRAAPAAAKPARSQAPAGPRLSLDDYLRTRNGGGR